MAKPLPGPWEWGTTEYANVRGVWTSNDLFPDDSHVADVYGRSPEEAEATARLIVAVHDLLEACESTVEEARERDEDMGCNCWPTLIAAIAKAKGVKPWK